MLHNQLLSLSQDYSKKKQGDAKGYKKSEIYTKLPSFQGIGHFKRAEKLKPLTHIKTNNLQLKTKPEPSFKKTIFNELRVTPQNSDKLTLMRNTAVKASKKTQILNQMIDILKSEQNTMNQNPFPRKTAPTKKRTILTEQSVPFNEFVDLRQSQSSTKKRGPQIFSNQVFRFTNQANGPFQPRRRIYSEEKARIKTEQYREQYLQNNANNMEVTFYKNTTPISRTAHVEKKEYDLVDNEFLCKEDF